MPRFVIETEVPAPIDVVFDMARSVELHLETQAKSGERAVAGVMSGLIGLGESVTWEATHLGVRQRLQCRIVAMDRPRSFRDSMVRGAFKRFDHDHLFEEHGGGTRMTDVFDYTSPLGLLGGITDRVFLRRYMRRLLQARADHIRRLAVELSEDELRRRFCG